MALAFAALLLSASVAEATTVRIVSYNVNLDTGFGGSGQLPGIQAVLAAIGQTNLNDNGTQHAQAPDVIALQELIKPSTGQVSSSLATIAGELNSVYGAGTYAVANVVDPVDSGTTGNGPSGIIYNTRTISFVSGTSLGSVSGSGAARAPVQYLLQPVGYSSAADFYVDVSHMKSATDATSASRRNIEANTIVNSVNALPANSHVVAVGDFNITSGSNEATYQTLRTVFHDPALTSATWDDEDTASRKLIAPLLSESATDVRFRDDIEFTSAAADHNSGIAGLQYDTGSFMVFGNGGSASLVNQNITSTSNTGVFPNLSATDRANLLFDLTEASDHLPIVADYDIVGISPLNAPEPASLFILTLTGVAIVSRRRS